MLTEKLKNYLLEAAAFARRSHKAKASLVHVLLSLLEDQSLREVLRLCGVNYIDVRIRTFHTIIDFSNSRHEAFQVEGESLSGLTHYVAQAAVARAQLRGALAADVLDFVAAILEIHDNSSVDFKARTILLESGVTVSKFAEARRTGEETKETVGVSSNLSSTVLRPSEDKNQEAAGADTRQRPAEQNRMREAVTASKDGGYGKTPYLERYAVNLTARASIGGTDKCFNRESVLRDLEIVLSRRKKGNAILVGEPGVGKTSIVEELARLVSIGKVGEKLSNSRIWSLDLASLVAGTKYRGELEERLQGIIGELKADRSNIVFIDEIHALGNPATSVAAAADLLKPPLASGEIRCIGGTTRAEYKRYFEADGALSRRFMAIRVKEPGRDDAIAMITASISAYADSHGVAYDNEAIALAVDLSLSTMPERNLPDKAIDILDEAGARSAMTGSKVVGAASVYASVAAQTGKGGSLSEAEVRNAASRFGKPTETAAAAFLRNRLPGATTVKVIALVGDEDADKEKVARALSVASDVPFAKVDMSEFRDTVSITGLIGAPPGYVGFETGGKLIEETMKAKGGILFLKNVDKAHQFALDVLEESIRTGVVRDKTGRLAGLYSCQVVVSADTVTERRIGFAAHAHNKTGISLVDDADAVIEVVEGNSRTDEMLGVKWLAELMSRVSACGAVMSVSEETATEAAAMFDNENEFRRFVEHPVLDMVASGKTRIVMEVDARQREPRFHEEV